MSTVYDRLTEAVPDEPLTPFDFVVIDEAQDLSVAQLRFLAAVAAERDDGLFFAGDLGPTDIHRPAYGLI